MMKQHAKNNRKIAIEIVKKVMQSLFFSSIICYNNNLVNRTYKAYIDLVILGGWMHDNSY